MLAVDTVDMAGLHNLLAMVGSLLEELNPKTLHPHIPALLALLTDALDLRNLKVLLGFVFSNSLKDGMLTCCVVDLETV